MIIHILIICWLGVMVGVFIALAILSERENKP